MVKFDKNNVDVNLIMYLCRNEACWPINDKKVIDAGSRFNRKNIFIP